MVVQASSLSIVLALQWLGTWTDFWKGGGEASSGFCPDANVRECQMATDNKIQDTRYKMGRGTGYGSIKIEENNVSYIYFAHNT